MRKPRARSLKRFCKLHNKKCRASVAIVTNVGLLRAVLRLDLNGEVRFLTYATWRIRVAIRS